MSRRFRWIGAAVMALTVGCAPATDDSDAAEAARLLATDREWAALSARKADTDTLVSYWTDDARFVGQGSPVVAGKEAIRRMVAGANANPDLHITWTADSAVVARSHDFGYTYGTTEISFPDATGQLVTSRGRYLLIWRKGADGRWRCVEDFGNSES